MKERSLRLPNGTPWRPVSGAHDGVVTSAIEKLGSRFMPGGVLLYAADELGAIVPLDTNYLAALGITLSDDVPLPNVLVHMPPDGRLVLVDAASSRGAMTRQRCEQLETHFGGGRAALVFVTAFASRADIAEHFKDIAWGTNVWVSEEPSHLIQLDGGKLRGPAPDASSSNHIPSAM